MLGLGIDARKAKKGAKDFADSADKAAKGAEKAEKATDKTTKSMDKAGKTAKGAGKHIAKLFAGLSGTIMLGSAVKTMADFEMTMRTVGAVTRANASDFERLSKAARALGASTKFSAKEAGEGLLFLARAGFSVDESIVSLPHTLNLAAAGALSLGEAADFASNILSQFNLNATEMERVVDALTIVSNRSNTNVRQLAEAMKYGGPIAGAFGVSIETSAAMIGVLGDRGIQASQAGTNLRGVLLALANPTDTARKALGKMGLTVEQVNPSLHSMEEILRTLTEAEMEAEDAGKIFGRRNAAAALIMAASVEQIDKLTQATREYAGETREIADVMSNTLAGSFKSLKSVVEELFLATGEQGLAGGVKDLVDTVTGALRILAGMEESVTRNKEAAHALAITLKVIGVLIATFVAAKVAAMAAGMLLFAKNMALAVSGAKALTTVMALNPFTAIVVAVGALVGALWSLDIAFGEADGSAQRHKTTLEGLHQTTLDVAAAQKRLNFALGKTNTAMALQAAMAKKTALGGQLSELYSGTGAKNLAEIERRASWMGGAPMSGMGDEQLASLRSQFRAIGAGDLPTLDKRRVQEQELGIRGKQPEYLDLVKTIRILETAYKSVTDEIAEFEKQLKSETDLKRKAANVDVIKAQFMRQIEDAQGRATAKLTASTAAEARALITREHLVDSAKRLGKSMGLTGEAHDEWIAKVEEAVTLLETLNGEVDERTRKARELAAAIKAEAAARAGAQSSLDDTLSGLREEIRVMETLRYDGRATAESLRVQTLAQILLKGATEEEVVAIKAQVEEILKLTAAYKGLTEEQARAAEESARQVAANASLEAYFETLRKQIEMTSLADDEARRIAEARNTAFDLSMTATGGRTLEALSDADAAEAAIRQLILLEKQHEAKETLAKDDGDAIRRAREFGDAWGQAFGEFITGAKSAEDAGRQLLATLIQIALRAVVAHYFPGPQAPAQAPAQPGATPAPVVKRANGGVFSGGRVTPFAGGAIVSQPTYFPLADDKWGLMGEAGEEGILPLERRGGKLGVRASGGGDTTIHVHQNIRAHNFDSFRRSNRQMAGDAKRAFGGGW
jgi:TP901 family phage tail tape measure protein